MIQDGMEPSEWRANENSLLERLMELAKQQESIHKEWLVAAEEDQELETTDYEKLEEEIDEVLDKLSFSTMAIPPESHRTALWDYLRSLAERDPESGFVVGWSLQAAAAWAMAMHYRRKLQPNHAAAVYEYIDHLFHDGLFHDETGLMSIGNYLPQMIEVYGELEDLTRLIELHTRAKDAIYAGAVDKTVLKAAEDAIAQVAASHPAEVRPQEIEQFFPTYLLEKHRLENELENAKFEIKRLEEGVLVADEERKAIEWMETHHSSLNLTPDGKRSLIHAKMCSEQKHLREKFSAWIAVLAGKAIEAEFNANIWQKFRDNYVTIIPEQFRRGALSINQIHRFLAGKGFSEEFGRGVLRKEYPNLFDQNHLKALYIVREDSTKARHGDYGHNIYTKLDLARLENALQLGEKNDWIYRFLHLLNRENRSQCQILR